MNRKMPLVLILATVVTVAILAFLYMNHGYDAGMIGKGVTVEYRPVVTQLGILQKQRSGLLKKISADWVVVEEGKAEIWVPRDMVLEIRLENK